MLKYPKLGYACEQLDTAIDLYFEKRSEIAIRTLSYAAREIIWGIQKAENIEGTPDAISILSGIRKEKFFKEINETCWNNLKHSHKEPEAYIMFEKAEEIEVLIFNAILDYVILNKHLHINIMSEKMGTYILDVAKHLNR